MKSDVMGIGAQISKKELKELTKETKETLAFDLDVKEVESRRTFGAIDLWNIRKQRIGTSVRRWQN